MRLYCPVTLNAELPAGGIALQPNCEKCIDPPSGPSLAIPAMMFYSRPTSLVYLLLDLQDDVAQWCHVGGACYIVPMDLVAASARGMA